jgi:hypothetical protein
MAPRLQGSAACDCQSWEVRAKLRGFGFGLDAAAAEQQRRRLSAIGDWQAGRVPITDPDPTTRNS